MPASLPNSKLSALLPLLGMAAAAHERRKLKAPYVWNGDKARWVEWSTKVKSYVRQMSQVLKDAMKRSEVRDDPITNAMLSDDEKDCLEAAYARVASQTVKDKISRVLQSDAWAKGDQHRWEGIARRHLEEIDRSDPDMCYKFSLYLSKKGPDAMDEAMRWADVALENRSRWSGDLHVKRVYSLYRLKAMAAQKKWQFLEQKYVEDPSEENLQIKDETRNLTKTLSREWLEYAREAKKDPTVALQLCISAAGTTGFCEGT